MGEILNAFGVDWKLISIQIFNFTILAVLLWYFLYTPVLNLLHERQEKIKKGISDADAAAALKEQTGVEKSAVLSAAQGEAEDVVKRAHEHASLKVAETLQKAEERASDIVADAEVKAEIERQNALKASETEVAKLAVLAAEKLLRSTNS
jgi:F-type H+-transporting ATPase subunit b